MKYAEMDHKILRQQQQPWFQVQLLSFFRSSQNPNHHQDCCQDSQDAFLNSNSSYSSAVCSHQL